MCYSFLGLIKKRYKTHVFNGSENILNKQLNIGGGGGGCSPEF